MAPCLQFRASVIQAIRPRQVCRLMGVSAFLLLFCFLSTSFFGSESPVATMTPAEKEWVQKHPVIRVGVDPDWAPFSFRDKKGKLQGLDLEILDLLSSRTGLRFQVDTKANWNEVIQAAREGKYDLLTSTAISPERRKTFIFSAPYFDFPVAIITRQNEPFLMSLDQLTGRRVATPREHVTTEALGKDYPKLKLVLTTNTAQALQMVSRGKADATVVQLAHASYLIRDMGLTNLKVSGITDYQFDLRYAIRPDWPELQSLLDNAVQSLPRHEVARILSRWVHVEREPWVTWNTIRNYLIGGLLLVAGAGVLLIFWNTLQRREIARRRVVEVALKAARDRLERLNEDKNSIMQMVAHDLRNPLTSIVAGAELVKMDLAGKTDPAVLENLDEILEQSGRIKTLVDEIVTVTALESGQQNFKHISYEAKVTVRRCVENLRGKATAKGIDLIASYPEGECVATGDPLALERIVDNLLSNAVKFNRPGLPVELKLEAGQEWLVLRVKDRGPGLNEDDKKKLFRKFSRLSAKPTAGEVSTGLGLSIVKALVTALGGEILYETKAGQGTTFVVKLPRHWED